LIKAFKIVGELLVDLEVSNSQKREEITQPQYTILEKSDNEKDPEHYQKDKRVTSIMLEVNRGLYLKENSYEKSEGYNTTKEIVQGYMNLLKRV
jgi:hypothetical protein